MRSFSIIKAHAQRRGQQYLDLAEKIEDSLMPGAQKLDLGWRLVTRAWTKEELVWMGRSVDGFKKDKEESIAVKEGGLV